MMEILQIMRSTADYVEHLYLIGGAISATSWILITAKPRDSWVR